MQKDLLIVGGAELPEHAAIMKAFVELAGGPEKRFAILPAATREPEAGRAKMYRWLGEAGVAADRVDFLPVSVALPGAARGAWDEAVLALARRADAVWFLGGNQNDLTRLLLEEDGRDSPLLSVLRTKTLGGTSAGAAVMSDPMIGAGTSLGALSLPRAASPAEDELGSGLLVTRGLGFFPEGIVDQHFDARARLGRLLEACLVEDAGRRPGFGVSEATGLIYRGSARRIEVVGRGGVHVLQTSRARRRLVETARGPRPCLEAASLSILRAGDSLDLASWHFEFGDKEPIGAADASLATPRPIASGPLSPYGDLGSACARLLLDNRPEGLWLDEATGLRHVKSYLIGESADGGLHEGFELRLGLIDGASRLYYGEGGYSFASVRVDILPIDVEIRPCL